MTEGFNSTTVYNMAPSIGEIIKILIKACAFSTVFALGLKTSWKDVTYLLYNPGLCSRSLLGMFLITPLIAVLLAYVAVVPMTIKVAVILMAISASVPKLPKKLLKLGADQQYVLSLSVITSLCAIVTIPLSVFLLGTFFSRAFTINIGQIATTIALNVFVPLLAGMIVRVITIALAEKLASPIMTMAEIITVVPIMLILATKISAVVGIGIPGLATIAVMTGASLAVGHLLGGPVSNNRTTLAIACATRFPGLGLLIASQNFPHDKPLPVVVAYLLISNLTVLPYLRWRKRLNTAFSPGTK